MNVYERVTERIVAALNSDLPPWRCPWGERQIGFPVSAVSGKPYHGVNVLLLWLQERPSPYWATARGWQKIGATVLPDQNPTEVVFCLFFDRDNQRIPYTKTYEVFNLYQVSGCPELRTGEVPGKYAPADRIIKKSKAKILYEGGSAVYKVDEDEILCPPADFFESAVGFYTTVFHELGHWTGKRLGREFGERGTVKYAKEELVAELCSCFLAANLKIPAALEEMPNHASYVKEWAAILSEDPRAIFVAAGKAQKAANFLLAFDKRAA